MNNVNLKPSQLDIVAELEVHTSTKTIGMTRRIFLDYPCKKVSLKQVRARFDQDFGKGAGKKVNLRCDRKGLISELWINLSGDISNEASERASVASLLEDAVDAGSSCKIGKV